MNTYKASGVVLGNLWGGGQGAYPAEKLEAKTKQKLIKEAKKMLESGALDSGMGYESLTSAILWIEEIKTIEKNKEEYQRSDFTEHYIGKPSRKDKDFLRESAFNFAC